MCICQMLFSLVLVFLVKNLRFNNFTFPCISIEKLNSYLQFSVVWLIITNTKTLFSSPIFALLLYLNINAATGNQ